MSTYSSTIRSTPNLSTARRRTCAAIERQHPIEAVHHRVDVREDHPGDAIVNDLADRAAVERGDRRAARHRFGHDETERFASLNGIEQRARAAVQLHFRLEIRFADIDDLPAIDVAAPRARGNTRSSAAASSRRIPDRRATSIAGSTPLPSRESTEEQQVVVGLFAEHEPARSPRCAGRCRRR